MAKKTPSEKTNPIKDQWGKLSAKHRRYFIVGAVSIVLIAGIWMAVGGDDDRQRNKEATRESIVSDIITSSDTRQLGVDGLNQRTRRLEKGLNDLNANFSRFTEKLEKDQEQFVTKKTLSESLRTMTRDLTNEQRSLMENQAQKFESQVDDDDSLSDKEKEALKKAEEERARAEAEKQRHDLWERPSNMAQETEDSNRSSDGSSQGSTGGSSIKIRKIGETEDESKAKQEAKAKKDIGVYLPAGSMITGTLLTGMDAPTNKEAQKEPFPALIRVKKEAILPNRYRLDVQECFIIASGYGSLSAERAYLRSEVLSCVRDDGGVIEVPLDAYASGEDGKAGLRGRVVSKQGQLLARSMMAGFASGMSQVFNRVEVPRIRTDGDSGALYQDVLSNDSITSGVVRGAGKALDRLAKFYLDMAKDIYPVIEINSNRRITFIVTKGGNLKTVNN